MRIPVLTCLLLAGAASFVSAAPKHEENTERVSYKDTKPKPKDAARNDDWVEIASATPTSHGREYIQVGAGAGTFTRLKVEAAKGRPGVRSLRVDYKNGGSHVYSVGKLLTKNSPAYVDLRGAHEIERIVVNADTGSSGSYRVLGIGETDQVAGR